MDIFNELVSRRSVKKFTDVPPTDEEIEKICVAGLHAPSGRNGQKVLLMVVKKKEVVKEIARLNAQVIGLNSDPFYNAPVVVVVFADRNHPTYLEDGSLVLGNMLNEAHSINVGACWIHRAKQTFETEEGRALARQYNIPEDYVGIGNCVLGFSDNYAPNDKIIKEGRIITIE